VKQKKEKNEERKEKKNENGKGKKRKMSSPPTTQISAPQFQPAAVPAQNVPLSATATIPGAVVFDDVAAATDPLLKELNELERKVTDFFERM